MSEITILKADSDVFMDLGSGQPYETWCNLRNYNDNVHSQAKYILFNQSMQGWNSWFTGWVKTNEDWLQRVADGDSLRIIKKIISITTLNQSCMEEALLTCESLSYEKGGNDYE